MRHRYGDTSDASPSGVHPLYMSPAAFPFSATRLRRRIALVMAVAVLFAGIAQAGHFHKLEVGTHNDVHLQCLLCMYSAGSAGPSSQQRRARIGLGSRRGQPSSF